MTNVVKVVKTQRVAVSEVAVNVLRLRTPSQASTIKIVVPGPQGPSGQSGFQNLADCLDVDTTTAIDRSLLRYDLNTGKWIGSPDTSQSEILNGGNF